MRNIIIILLGLTLGISSTWQNIQSPTETKTILDVQSGNIERSLVEFNIDGFHLTNN